MDDGDEWDEDEAGAAEEADGEEEAEPRVVFSLYVDIDAALARVLNVTAPAVRKAPCGERSRANRTAAGKSSQFSTAGGPTPTLTCDGRLVSGAPG